MDIFMLGICLRVEILSHRERIGHFSYKFTTVVEPSYILITHLFVRVPNPGSVFFFFF